MGIARMKLFKETEKMRSNLKSFNTRIETQQARKRIKPK